MRHLAITALVLVSASSSSLADGWKKAYFGATPPGAWARYQQSASVGSPSTCTMSRLADDGDMVRLEELTDFADGSLPTSTNVYSLAGGFSVERDLIDFPKALVAVASGAGKETPAPMPAETVASMKSIMSKYGPTAVFEATETISGKSCDRYAYTIDSGASVETGELWLSDAVPFGLVKKVWTAKDKSGKVLYSGTQDLVGSGLKAAAPAAKPASREPARFTLAEAFDAGRIVVHVEVDESVKDGGKLLLVVESKQDEPFTLLVPAGRTALRLGVPIDEIVLRSSSAETHELTSTEPVRLSLAQEGEQRVTAGEFQVSVIDGKAMMVGSATTGWVE